MKRKWKAMDLAVMGLLIALTIIASKYLKIEIGTMYRVNFSSAFIMLSGIWLGPIGGAFVGLVSDLLGCLMAAYPINILYTLMPVMIGVFSGLGEPLFRNVKNRPVLSVFVYGLFILVLTFVASALYGTWALSVYYGTPFLVNFPGRVAQGLITTVLNTTVVYLLYRSPVTAMLNSQTVQKRQPEKID